MEHLRARCRYQVHHHRDHHRQQCNDNIVRPLALLSLQVSCCVYAYVDIGVDIWFLTTSLMCGAVEVRNGGALSSASAGEPTFGSTFVAVASGSVNCKH